MRYLFSGEIRILQRSYGIPNVIIGFYIWWQNTPWFYLSSWSKHFQMSPRKPSDPCIISSQYHLVIYKIHHTMKHYFYNIYGYIHVQNVIHVIAYTGDASLNKWQDKSLNCLGNGKKNKKDILNILYFLLTCNVMHNIWTNFTCHKKLLNELYIQKTKFSVCRLKFKKIVITRFMLDRTVHRPQCLSKFFRCVSFSKTQIALKFLLLLYSAFSHNIHVSIMLVEKQT